MSFWSIHSAWALKKVSRLGASQSFWSCSFEYVGVLQIVPWTRIPMAFISLTRLSSFSKYYFFSQAWKVLEVEAYQEIQKQRWTQCITVTVILIYESCFWKRLRNLPRDSLSHNLSLQVDSTRNLTKELIKQSWFLWFSSPCIYFHKWNGFQILEFILCLPDRNHPLYGSNTLLFSTSSPEYKHQVWNDLSQTHGGWKRPSPTQWQIKPFWSELHRSAPRSISWCLWLESFGTPLDKHVTSPCLVLQLGPVTVTTTTTLLWVLPVQGVSCLYLPWSSPILSVLSCPPISMRRLLSGSSEQQRAGGWDAMVIDWNRRCSAWQ